MDHWTAPFIVHAVHPPENPPPKRWQLFHVQGLIRLEAGLRPIPDIRRDGQRLSLTGTSATRLESSTNLTTWTTVKVFTESYNQHAVQTNNQNRFFRLVEP